MQNLVVPVYNTMASIGRFFRANKGPLQELRCDHFSVIPSPQTLTLTHMLTMTNSLWRASVNMARKGPLPLPRADKAVESASGQDWVSLCWMGILLPVNHLTFLAEVRKQLWHNTTQQKLFCFLLGNSNAIMSVWPQVLSPDSVF